MILRDEFGRFAPRKARAGKGCPKNVRGGTCIRERMKSKQKTYPRKGYILDWRPIWMSNAGGTNGFGRRVQ